MVLRDDHDLSVVNRDYNDVNRDYVSRFLHRSSRWTENVVRTREYDD